ncbi:rod shape-determining protein MreD [Vaginisenegalia massiliensis]|uniref:rod shape-determining protein MreD n=1 Tax=Vaginisenegalia massiliensis TaxID=2058294 RepID=UPI000F522863|nr:rod shape-determining protein MreD [Vaginisenegalia massiliensis]
MKMTRDRKIRWFVPLMLFLSVMIDSALPAIFPKAFLDPAQTIVSHLTLFCIITFAFYFKDAHIVLYGFIFGLLTDSYNTLLLGLYATLYFFVALIVVRIKKFFPRKAFVHYMFFIVAISFVDFLVFVFYKELNMIHVVLTEFLVQHLTPTLIFNTVLSFALYFPTKWILSWLGYEDYIIF